MSEFKNLKKYSVLEINNVLDTLRKDYDIVRLADTEECRVLEVHPDGSLHYNQKCYEIWGREGRCINCSSYRACKTHSCVDKNEYLGNDVEAIHSVPIYLQTLSGELEICAIECVKCVGTDPEGAKNDTPSHVPTHDVLTQLYTTDKLFREIRQRLIDFSDEKYLLVMLNVRNFKLLNRLFGIDGGNRLLVGIADNLRTLCTDEEIYGRYRDDHFIIFIKKNRFQEDIFANHMKNVESLLESPICKVRIKFGVYEIPNPYMSIATMAERAELAAETIRDSMEQQFAYYDPYMTERKLKDQRIISTFEQALKDGEFTIYLQPQVRDDGLITGAEALVRWILPDGTMRPPIDFLGVLQQSELLSDLDTYVWESAVKLLCKWKTTSLKDMYISINVDPTDFYYIDVPKVLADLCRKYDISPEKLRVEITETALIEDAQNQSAIVEKLHDAGFIVEIDDFGKGSSSLSLLKDIQADVLKIDMGFIQGEKNAERSTIILESVIGMAKNLNMGLITEGVETREQTEKLIQMGCYHFQGFYFSRPIPVADFEMVVQSNNPMS